MVGGDVEPEHWRNDEMKPTIETLARRYVEARDEVARLKREREACVCDHDPMDEAGVIHGKACWRGGWEPDCTDSGRYGSEWVYNVDPADWCDSCKRRQAIHVQIRPAQRRMAARLGAIVSATRASCFQSGKE